MAITPEMQRRMAQAQVPTPSKQLLKEKVWAHMEILRIASGHNSIQGFGRMSIGAIVLSMIFSLATLLAILYPYFAQKLPDIAIYVYPLLVGLIIFLFYTAINYIKEGFIMFEQSKGQEDAALERFIENIFE
jgi:hypothetical protein